MKIHGVKLENFTIFDKLDAEFSPNVNIICGENSTGKTSLIKLLYACAKTCPDMVKDKRAIDIADETARKNGLRVMFTNTNRYYFLKHLFTKLGNVFSLTGGNDAQRLANLRSDASAWATVNFGGEIPLRFFLRAEKIFSKQPISLKEMDELAKRDNENFLFPDTDFPEKADDIVYIPSKEMISATENFSSLYEEYHIAFEETYYDLCQLLNRPRKKTLPPDMQGVVTELETLIGGKVRQKGGAFYLDMENVGELPMGLVSEGYRKLATLLNLVETGSLAGGSILFWDEPETNLNPRMAAPLVQAILTLAAAGVQVFVTTHDYFIQQYFGLAAEYGDKFQSGAGNLDYRFLSLYRKKPNDPQTITLESAPRLSDLENNAVREEFDAVYDREQGLIYGDDTE